MSTNPECIVNSLKVNLAKSEGDTWVKEEHWHHLSKSRSTCINKLTFLLQLVVAQWGHCNYSPTTKGAYGFHGTPSKFHCLSSIPLILAYNVYSQVNWTGTSLWAWRSLLRRSEAAPFFFLFFCQSMHTAKTSTASERGAAVLPVTVHEWLCEGSIWDTSCFIFSHYDVYMKVC